MLLVGVLACLVGANGGSAQGISPATHAASAGPVGEMSTEVDVMGSRMPEPCPEPTTAACSDVTVLAGDAPGVVGTVERFAVTAMATPANFLSASTGHPCRGPDLTWLCVSRT